MAAVSFQPTAGDVLAAYRAIYGWSLRRPRFRWRLGIGAVLMGAVCWAALSGPDPADQAIAVAQGVGGWLLFLGTVLGLHWLLMPRRVRRVYAQQRSLKDERTIEWDALGLSVVTHRSSARYEWAEFFARVQNRGAVVLMQSEAAFTFIPMRVLTPAQVDEIMGPH